MHGDVDLATQHRFFNLLDEEAFAADHCQGHIENLVALGFNLGQGDFHLGVTFFQFRFNPLCLPECQGAGASTNAHLLFSHLSNSFMPGQDRPGV